MQRIKYLVTFGLLLLIALWFVGSRAASVPVYADSAISADGALSLTTAWAQSAGTTLTSDQRQQLAKRTVQIVMLQDTEDGYFIIGAGSGTLISPTGLILTNAHVASPKTVGVPEDEPDALGIALLTNEDEPPVPSFFASVVAVDGYLDLAVLQIDQNLDGSAIRPTDLALPYVAMGNSDDLHLGDNVYIFGFPGIGGDTITFTRGTIAGFSSQDPIGNRAWIKTDATIAGGNSGGLAVSDAGSIVGVPTRASSGANGQITDCRVVQDTNGDGSLDDRDNCIPIGGFINALRPVNLAKALIRAVEAGSGYGSPYPTLGGVTTTSGQQQFQFEGWSESADNQGCAVNVVSTFPSGTTRVTAVFSYAGLTEGETLGYAWLIDGESVAEGTFEWDGDASGSCYPFWLENGGKSLPDGEYVLLLGAGEELRVVAQAETQVGGVVSADTIQMSGTITDAETGKAIAGALVIVLQPGVDVGTWLDAPDLDTIYTFAETDARGGYFLPELLARDVRYEAVVLADGYLDETGYLEFSTDDPDSMTINVALSR
ncbi:MAG: serine protease [Anaerolineae bacterium]|nr:serine protease [Anaerolineae bacterium]